MIRRFVGRARRERDLTDEIRLHLEQATKLRTNADTDGITGAFGASPVAFGGRPGPSRQTGFQLIIGR